MKYMKDINGDEVNVKYVNAYDKARDRVSRRILKRFVEERKRMEALLKDSLADLDSLMKLKDSLGDRGNFQTQSFDGLIQVEVRQQYNVYLDERVIKARELMIDYVNHVLEKVNGVDVTVLRRLVDSAFRANSRGFLPVSKIHELKRMVVNDPRWQEAIKILEEAMKPVKGKRYLNCATRRSTQGDFQTIRLDLATCWPETISSSC